MRGVNQYDTFEQFYNEYNYDRNPDLGHYIGLDFIYKKKCYRLGHDYSNSDNKHKLKYWAYEFIVKESKTCYEEREYKVLGRFHNLDKALDNWIIDGVTFRKVIMEEKTEVIGQD